MGKIYIPQTCRVGFQEREDTFAGRLAYVIYYDSFGKLRKEKSWTGWCELDKIEPFDFKNEPTSGFVLNKGIRRFNWSHFGSGRSMIRVYDPRGIEFEVTPENLIGLLMHTDCNHREIQDDLVYAWMGTELMLLPCSSEEYASAKKFTSLQAKNVKASELREGFTYVTKQEDQLVYLGRHLWYEHDSYYSKSKKGRVGKKQHVFCDPEGKDFSYIKSVPAKIGAVLSEHCHDQLANLVDAYLKTEMASKIVTWAREPLTNDWFERNWDQYYHKAEAFTEIDGEIYSVLISNRSPYRPYDPSPETLPFLVYTLYYKINSDGSMSYVSDNREFPVGDRTRFFSLRAIFENGLQREWRT